MVAGRPYYSQFAWAYDLLVDDPVEPWVDAVEEALRARGVEAPARVLDAGCGTGRHAAELVARGHSVVLLEPVPEMLDQARSRLPDAPAFQLDLSAPPPVEPVDAAVCRGVLNDLLGDEEREAALRSLAAVVRRGGVLVLDVRDRDATARRYAGGRTQRRAIEAAAADPAPSHFPPGLVFVSDGSWDAAAGLVRVRERHEIDGDVVEYDFAMRPWTPEEVRERLGRAGFVDVAISTGAGGRPEDRLFVVATRA